MPADTAVRVRLTRLSGAQAGEKIDLSGAAVRIGSSPYSDVKFDTDDSKHVAPVHAKIVLNQGVHWLYDNQTDECATLVNGELIQSQALRSGDELRFGAEGPRLRFEQVAEPAPAVSTPAASGGVPATPVFRAQATEMFDRTLVLQAAAGETADHTILSVPESKKKTSTAIDTLALRSSTEHSLDAATVTIGRSRGNDIVLDHPQISSLHAQVEKEGDRYVLVDRGSANGTFVGTERIKKRVLAPDDMIHIGPYTLVYHGKKLFAYSEKSASSIDIVHVSKDVGGGLKLLDDVTLRIDPSELVGMIGPSGAGKSTLLGVLNGLRRATSGRVLVNGLDLVQHYDSLKSFMGFVPQDDIIHAELSPDRTLHYVSLLRLPKDTSRAERRTRIDEVLKLLEMTERRHLPIHRLSGGQRKRVSIGVELLTEPQLLFLDEPTAGLDPALESKMMVLFKELAHSGKTVLVTTHVMENVHLFDKLLVLVRGKLCFYGSPDDCMKHFGITDMRKLYDKLATAEPDEWRRRFAPTPQFEKHVKRVDANAAAAASATHEVDAALLRKRSQSRGFFAPVRQLSILARRQIEILLRDRKNTALLFLQAPVVAGFIALAMDSPALITFMLALSSIWFGTTNAAKEIVKELPIYRRERMVNLGIVPYVASKALVLSLLATIQCLLLVGVVEAFRHVPGDTVMIYLTLLLSSLSGVCTGLAISAFVETTDKATALVPLILIPQVLFAGVFTPLTGLSGHVGMAMPTRWSYDLLKRVVMETQKEKEPPLIDYAEKNESERELIALEAHSKGAIAEIDSKSQLVAAAVKRIDATRHEMNEHLVQLGEHEKAAGQSYERTRGEMAAIEKETTTIGHAVEKERQAAAELRRDFEKVNGKPELARDLLTPKWADDRRARLEEAANDYAEVEKSIAAIEVSKRHLGDERTALEERGKDARKVEGELHAAKERLEKDGAVLVAVGAAVRVHEEELKADAARIREIQGVVTENLKKRRYVPLLKRDSVFLDASALGAFCLLLSLLTLALQKLRDREP